MGLGSLLIFVVCFLASLLGPLCGIGGGVIIKPVVDALGVLPVASASFLSSISVLTMALATTAQYTFGRSWLVDARALLPIATGSALGGFFGKMGFDVLSDGLPDTELVGGVQALVLICLCVVVLAYTLNKARVPSHHVGSSAASLFIGFGAGACWSFLGIGGGPFNLALLGFLFSMESKPAAQASLFIIAFSQVAGLAYSLMLGVVPDVDPALLVGACLAAAAGSVVGRHLARQVDSATVDRLYLMAFALIIILSAWNVSRFLL